MPFPRMGAGLSTKTRFRWEKTFENAIFENGKQRIKLLFDDELKLCFSSKPEKADYVQKSFLWLRTRIPEAPTSTTVRRVGSKRRGGRGAIPQWIFRDLQSCGHWFESQAHYLYVSSIYCQIFVIGTIWSHCMLSMIHHLPRRPPLSGASLVLFLCGKNALSFYLNVKLALST